jgi:hypothetical protein
MFKVKVSEKTKHTFYVQELFLNRLWDNVEKCGRAREATDDNIMHCVCRIPKAINAHSKYVIFIAFP